jgi:DNA end-binding protein Ku
MVGVTLRYPYEVRQPEEYFDTVDDEKVPKDMLDLAIHIVDTKRGKFEPEKFEDHYENALKELLRKKQKSEKIERPREPARTNVVNLMEALRQSVQAEGGKQSRATRAQSKKGKKRIAGQREMLLPKSPARRIKRPPLSLPRARVAVIGRRVNRGLAHAAWSVAQFVERRFA